MKGNSCHLPHGGRVLVCHAQLSTISRPLSSASLGRQKNSDIKAAGLLKFSTNGKFLGTLLMMMCDVDDVRASSNQQVFQNSPDISACRPNTRTYQNMHKNLENSMKHPDKLRIFVSAPTYNHTGTCDSIARKENLSRSCWKISRTGFRTTLYWPAILLFARSSCKEIVGGNGIEIINALKRLCPTLGKQYTE